MSSDLDAISRPVNVFLLCLAVALIPMFPLRMKTQETHGRPMLIPNSIWRNRSFTSICIMVIFAWAALQCVELFLSLLYVESHRLLVPQNYTNS
jgi:hypothetical protein